MKLRVFLCLVLCTSFFLSPMGCNRKKDKKVGTLIVKPGQTPEELFAKGEKMLKKKRYEEAIENFEAIKNNFPYSEISAEAELKVAESYFEWKEYLQASESYSLFGKLHPLHPKSDYAMYKQVESLYLEAPKTIDRDLIRCHQAVSLSERFFKRYPLSDNLQKVHGLAWKCKQRLAGHEYYVGRFYYRTKRFNASTNRLKGVLQNHSGFGYDEKAAWYLGLAHYKLEEWPEAKGVYNQLLEKFPETNYANRVNRKMKKIDLKISEGSS